MEVEYTTRQTIILEYKDILSRNKKIFKKEHVVEDYFYGFGGDHEYSVTLKCWHLEGTIPGFSQQAEGYQYNLRWFNGTRPKAWRVPFLEDPEYENVDFTVSHLCHNNRCYYWKHHVFEPLAVNKSRNGCPGGKHCHHTTKCLIPGPYYNY